MPIRKAEDYYDEPDDQNDRLAGDTEGEESAVGLLPKSILKGQDAKVGDQLVLTITGIHDDQVEVAYPTGEDQPDESPEDEVTEPEEAPPTEPESAPVGGENYE